MPMRWVEFTALYAVLPVSFAVVVWRTGYRRSMAPILWVASLGVLAALLRDPTFDSSTFLRLPLRHPHVKVMAVRFAVLGAGLLALGRWRARDGFLRLPRERPGLFLLFVVLYPALSVLPQGLIWRVFLVHRYALLFGDPATLTCAGAVAFSLAHLTYRNGTALFVTVIGGTLFLDTYLKTGSMLLSALEHGAYGMTAFTAGLGRFLYLGAERGTAPASRARPRAEPSSPRDPT
jgi:hypothetical protein